MSNRRFRRAENVVLIDMTSTGLVDRVTHAKYLLIIVARSYPRNQVQTLGKINGNGTYDGLGCRRCSRNPIGQSIHMIF